MGPFALGSSLSFPTWSWHITFPEGSLAGPARLCWQNQDGGCVMGRLNTPMDSVCEQFIYLQELDPLVL